LLTSSSQASNHSMMKQVFAIACLTLVSGEEEASLWDRMGGEAVMRPLCNDLYDRHLTNPILAPWFDTAADWNERTADQVKENVFTFFSAGIGGPHKYEGKNMVEAHEKMGSLKPISEAAFHSLTYHVLEMMQTHGAGGDKELDEVLGILNSMKGSVMKHGQAKFEEGGESLWVRMGGEEKIRPMVNSLYLEHGKDPLTSPWWNPNSEWNSRTAAQVKEHVFNFFSSGIGGPHKYEGRNMIEAHAGMRGMKAITETAFHALVFHVLTVMDRHSTGGARELDEVWGILQSLKAHVITGKDAPKEEL